jgi:hypothetical protein
MPFNLTVTFALIDRLVILNELLFAVRGLMTLVTFDEQRNLIEAIHFESDRRIKK